MFGHLKAEDFTNLIEGGTLSAKLQAHLKACAQCTEAFVSAQNFHGEMSKSAVEDQSIPEPDWFQFRADVRNTMLSRAAQRQARSSNWSGWLLRPAMTWGLAVAFAAGLSAGLLVWNHSGTIAVAPLPAQVEVATLDASDASNIPDEVSIDPSLSSWSQTSVFEELSQLDEIQAEKLQRLLEADAHQGPSQ